MCPSVSLWRDDSTPALAVSSSWLIDPEFVRSGYRLCRILLGRFGQMLIGLVRVAWTSDSSPSVWGVAVRFAICNLLGMLIGLIYSEDFVFWCTGPRGDWVFFLLDWASEVVYEILVKQLRL